MKKSFLIAAVVVFILAAVSVAYGVERYMSYNESMDISDQQFQKSGAAEKAGYEDQAIRFMEYSADNAENANQAKYMAMAGFGGAVLLLLGGLYILKKGKE